MPSSKKKLIEVALPLESINRASAREKSIRQGHPSTLHLWWARRPLAACRAVLFSSLVDDPSARPDEFPTEEAQDAERQRLFQILEELVVWENSTDERVLAAARAEIQRSTQGSPPPVLDPFCGGGSIPLEAQRLGLEAWARDLNPVAVLITKAMIDLPVRFPARPPVNSEARVAAGLKTWSGTQGLAEDVHWYGRWVLNEAERRVGHLFPSASLPAEHGGGETTPLAWLWARTVKCPNPACGATTPLLSSYVLSAKPGRKTFVRPIAEQGHVSFRVTDVPPSADPSKGLKRGTSGVFECAVCGTVTDRDYVAAEGKAGRIGQVPTVVVARVGSRRVYLPSEASPVPDCSAGDLPELDVEFAENPRDIWCRNFGLTRPRDLFTQRQLIALATFADLVPEVREKVVEDAREALESGAWSEGREDESIADYADCVATYIGLAVSRLSDYSSTLATWASNPQMEIVRGTFARQALPMTWDFAEANVFGSSSGSFGKLLDWVVRSLSLLPSAGHPSVGQLDCTAPIGGDLKPLVCTDPPYYDNIAYADLSDFFYVWLRRSLRTIYPQLFSTLLTPKSQELVAASYRFDGDGARAKKHFEDGLAATFQQLKAAGSPEYPLTLFYAFRQAENSGGGGVGGPISTGWETMLTGLLSAGFAVTGTWPMRSERAGRSVSIGTNALASSVVLVCRPRDAGAPLASRREFLSALKSELPEALHHLQHGNIAPVDLAQASIGPGMAVYSRYSKVLEADGSSMSVRTALGLINQALDEVVAEQEGEFDGDTRWAIAWFQEVGLDAGDYGRAELLSKAKVTSVQGMVEAGILEARAGKVRLLRREELDPDWNPATDRRLTVWEMTQHLIGRLDQGEAAAATLARQLGENAEVARDLAYRLYLVCERKKWAQEGQAYNSLVVAWPQIQQLAAAEPGLAGPSQTTFEV